MGGLSHWYSEEGPRRDEAPPSPFLAVPNVTVRPSTAIVPTSYYEHLYSPRMVEEIKEAKNGTSTQQTVIWPNYLNYSV